MEKFGERFEHEPHIDSYPEIRVGALSDVDGLYRFSELMASGGKEAEEYARFARGNNETMRLLPAAFGRPGGREGAIEQLVRHKGYSQKEATDSVDGAFSFLSAFQAVDADHYEDGERRMREVLPKIKANIETANNFFRPRAELFGGKKRVTYLPDGPWREDKSGFGVDLGEEILLSVDPDSQANAVHEYLHGFINEITERVEITQEETERLASLAKKSVRQHYGTDSKSLWNEAIIRAYRDGLRPGNEPINLEKFRQEAKEASRELFETFFKKNNLPDHVETFLSDEARQAEIFEEFARDRLLESAWQFLNDYNSSKTLNPDLRFEDYFSSHYRDMLPEKE